MSNKKIIITIIVLIIIGIAWYALSPLLRNKELQEVSPLGDATVSTDNSASSQIGVTATTSSVTIVKTTSTSTEAAILLGQGDFVARAHDVKGKALLIKDGNSTIVRFENFETINGPDVRIYLSKDLTDKDYVDLGQIKATRGNINYQVPANVDVSVYNNVLVWCEDFSVLFSYASIK